MYYSEAISFPPLFTLLVFVLYAIIALAPAYGVFRQKDYVTALICAVCGLFGCLCSAISCGGCDRFEEAAAGSGAGD